MYYCIIRKARGSPKILGSLLNFMNFHNKLNGKETLSWKKPLHNDTWWKELGKVIPDVMTYWLRFLALDESVGRIDGPNCAPNNAIHSIFFSQGIWGKSIPNMTYWLRFLAVDKSVAWMDQTATNNAIHSICLSQGICSNFPNHIIDKKSIFVWNL